MKSPTLVKALEKCTVEQQAGFAAHLAMLMGPSAELPQPLLRSLEEFFTIAGLKPKQSAAERQKRIDHYFKKWPLPSRLLALLDAGVAKHVAADAGKDGYRKKTKASGGPSLLAELKPTAHLRSVADPDALFSAKKR